MTTITTPMTDSDIQTSMRRALWISTVAILVLQVLDLVTTFAVLNRGGAEINPLADFLINTELFGLVPLVWVPKLGLPFSIMAALLRKKDEDITVPHLAVSWAVTGFYTMLIVSNSLVLWTLL